MSQAQNKPSNLGTRLKLLYTHDKFTDCSFMIENSMINSHKLILASASPVFEAMFYGPLAEKSCIEITDISYDIFESMIKFIYSDEIDDNLSTNIEYLIELHYCAEKYLINDLLVTTLNRFKHMLKYSNILQALDYSVCLNLKNLTQICLNFIKVCCLNNPNFATTFMKNDNNMYHMSKNCLNILLNEKFNENNYNLIILIKEWCRTECECLNLDFNDCVNIKFTLNDINIPDDIFNELVNARSLQITDYAFVSNDSNGISCQRTYYKAVKPFVIGHNRDDRVFITTLICDRYIALKSIEINSQLLPSQPHLPTKYTEKMYVQILSSADQNVIFEQKSIVLNVEYNSVLHIPFEKSVILAPDTSYSIKLLWDNSAIGHEYPRNIFAVNEKQTYCNFQFDKNYLNFNSIREEGSIVTGIRYAILN